MPVYLDMAATTPVDPAVADLVLDLMTRDFGNAGSRTHVFGADAQASVNKARGQIAQSLAVDAADVVFTSGATEADNIALLGLAPFGLQEGKRHIVSTAIEHKAVLEPLLHLKEQGFEVTLVEPDLSGYVDAQKVLSAIRPDTLLVSVMHANNETGAIQPIEEIAQDVGRLGAFFHVDAAQTFGRLNGALAHPGIDLISLSGHKIYAPKGIGALVMKRREGRRAPVKPLMYGGGQEKGIRPGTLPVPLIAGFGLAAKLADKEHEQRARLCRQLRAQALATLAPLSPFVHGDDARGVLPHILSIAIPGIDSEAVMVATKDILSISNGSACTSASYEPSHVLEAMGVEEDLLNGTVRISWSHATKDVPWRQFVERLDDLRL